MAQTATPYLFLRGGTSRGSCCQRSELPQDQEHSTGVLMATVDAGHPLTIAALGRGNALTMKVAMLPVSARDECDVDCAYALDLTGYESSATVGIGHPSGPVGVRVGSQGKYKRTSILSSGVVHTRLLARGEVMVPAAVWSAAP